MLCRALQITSGVCHDRKVPKERGFAIMLYVILVVKSGSCNANGTPESNSALEVRDLSPRCAHVSRQPSGFPTALLPYPLRAHYFLENVRSEFGAGFYIGKTSRRVHADISVDQKLRLFWYTPHAS